MSFMANYTGVCAGECERPILPGQLIERIGTEYIHVECENGHVLLTRESPNLRNKLCPVCHMLRSVTGVCACS